MALIKRLPPKEVRKIAAGEVIERPANIAKELIENSIDAGATQITLHVHDGGKEAIRIIDNGCGMTEEDACLCCEHHATSKINTVEDLETLESFGFRGEALSSIAAASSITLTTKTAAAQTGIKLTLELGEITTQEAVSANTGTDIAITNILHNLPARKKFLKTRETELNHIKRFFHAFCICHQQIHFKLYSEDNLVLNCPATSSLITRIGQVWDAQSAPHLLTLTEHHSANEKKGKFSITGALSNHQHARYDRENMLFFINNRLVKNQTLSRALLKGYAQVLPPKRFPTACIFFTVDPKTIDVNIHPRKEEVQFMHPRIIEQALENAVHESLEQHIAHTVHSGPEQAQPEHEKFLQESPFMQAHPAEAFDNQLHKQVKPDTPSKKFESALFDRDPLAYTQPLPYVRQAEHLHAQSPVLIGAENFQLSAHQATPTAHPQALPESSGEQFFAEKQDTIDNQQTSYTEQNETALKKNYTLLGQLHKTYLLLEKQDGLYLVDQHAAHERILYERFRSRFDDAAIITLMFPHFITLSPDAITTISPYLSLFQTMGIAIDLCSDTQLAITATPVYLKNIDFQELIQNTLSFIAEFENLQQEELTAALNKKIQAQMACKAAIKAGDELTHTEMVTLLDDLEKTANNFSCPHGRPTGWLLSSYEIEKRFKRKL